MCEHAWTPACPTLATRVPTSSLLWRANATTDPTKIGTENYTVKLEKGQGRCTFLDSVRLRGESFENIDRQQLGIIQARADKIDNHILSTLYAGAGQTKAATSTFGPRAACRVASLVDVSHWADGPTGRRAIGRESWPARRLSPPGPLAG